MTEKTGQLKMCGNVQGNFQSTWIIEHFSSLDYQVEKCYCSETFQVENGGIDWYLMLYPGGDRELCKDYVSCFVHKKNIERKVNFKYVISLRNTKGDILFYKKRDVLIPLDGPYGYNKAIERKSLLTKLENDILLVCFEVIHCTNSVKSDVGIDRCVEISPTLKLVDDLRNLWISKELTDCVISVGDVEIPVHSAILGARSKVFAAMFKHDTKEKDTSRVEVTDFKKDTMESFMEFIYSGSVHGLDFDGALELLRASDKYEVSDLKLYCSNYLLSLLDNDNVCQILLNADIYNAEKLRVNAMKYFCRFLSEMDASAERSAFETRPGLVFDILQNLIEQKKNKKPKST